jgi:hypothetical protein
MRFRDQRGQTGADYLGVLFLVALIGAAAVASGVADKVATETRRLVCEIAGGRCEDDAQADVQPARDGHPAGADGPDQGPAIPNGPLVVLPFPGSVSVTCSAGKQGPAPQDDPKGCKGPKAPGGNSFGVKATGTVTAERSPTKLNDKGCPVQVLSTSTTLKLAVGGKSKETDGKDKTVVSGALEVFLAASSKYQITVPPDQADDIASNRRDAPNPVDPTTLRPGESVLLSQEFYAGHGLDLEYRSIQAQLGYEEGRRVSSGVTRVDDRTVRVYVGDEHFVRNAAAFGIGGVSFGSKEELADGKLRAVDIDISRPEGWNAYQQFVASGKLPAGDAPGTSQPTSATTVKYSDPSKIEIKGDNGTVGGLFGDSEGSITETTYPDGRVRTTVTGRVNDVGLEYTADADAEGNPIGEPSYALNLEGVRPDVYSFFQQLNGRDPQPPPDGHVRLEFTRDDLETIRRQALSQIAWEAEEYQGIHPRPSIEEVAANPDKYDSVNPITNALARAKSPDHVLPTLFRVAGGDPNHLLDQVLVNHTARTKDAAGVPLDSDRGRLPGTASGPNCP